MHDALIGHAASIVSAYVSNNSVVPGDVPALMSSVHATLRTLASGGTPAVLIAAQEPAVPVKKSVTPDYIVCLEDGKKFKSLRRHLRTAYNLSPEDYRARWHLPQDYPMVAANYSARRTEIAKSIGLGTSRATAPAGAAA